MTEASSASTTIELRYTDESTDEHRAQGFGLSATFAVEHMSVNEVVVAGLTALEGLLHEEMRDYRQGQRGPLSPRFDPEVEAELIKIHSRMLLIETLTALPYGQIRDAGKIEIPDSL